MRELHQSTSIAGRILDALDQFEGANQDLFFRRFREDAGGCLGAQIENLGEITIPTHTAFADRCRVHNQEGPSSLGGINDVSWNQARPAPDEAFLRAFGLREQSNVKEVFMPHLDTQLNLASAILIVR